MDVVYMGRGSQQLHTCWIPLGDIPLQNGPMSVLPTSHCHPAMEKIRATYGKMDVDRDGISGGWFTNDYLELSRLVDHPWVSSDFNAGDVVIMGIYLMHGSVKNDTERLRLSVDTRFQPASHPTDERWVGEDPVGHALWFEKERKGQNRSIRAARAEWGV